MLKLAAATLVSVLAAATPALADDSTTSDWKDVSNINHQLVKVGEHGDYMLTYKKVNISTNPIGWIAGSFGASAEYAVTENIVLRADGNYFKGGVFGDGVTGYEVGLSMPIYLKRAYSGPFIEPGIIARGMTTPTFDGDSSSSPAMTTSTDTMVGPEALVGYHWMFDSGLNVALAAGVARDLSGNSSDPIQPAGYFRVGYAF